MDDFLVLLKGLASYRCALLVSTPMITNNIYKSMYEVATSHPRPTTSCVVYGNRLRYITPLVINNRLSINSTQLNITFN